MNYYNIILASLILNSFYSICYSNYQIYSADTVNYEKKATNYLDNWKLDSAALYFGKAAIYYKKQRNWYKCVQNYRLASKSFYNNASYDSSMAYSQKALQVADKYFRGDSLEISEHLNILLIMGDVYNKTGKYNEALKIYNDAMRINELNNNNNFKFYVKITGKIASIYIEKAEYEQAYFLLNTTLDTAVKKIGPNALETIELYDNLGWVYEEQGKYDKSLENNLKALLLKKEKFGEKHPLTASCYNNLGLLYRKMGEFDKALESFNKGISIIRETMGENHFNLSKSYRNIGVIYAIKGFYDKSLEFFHKDISISKENLGEKHPVIGDSYSNIGNVYRRKGEYEEALEYQQKAISIWKEVLGEKHRKVAGGYNNSANCYSNMGEYEKSLSYYNKALSIRKEAFGEKHPLVADSYSNIGNTYEKKGEYEKALEFLKKALSIRLELYGENYPNHSLTYNIMGIIYKNKNEYEKSLTYYNKALSINEKVFGKKNPEVAGCYNSIGEVYYLKNSYDSSLIFYQKAIAANVPNYSGSTINDIQYDKLIDNCLSAPVILQSLMSISKVCFLQYQNTSNSVKDLEMSIKLTQYAFRILYKIRTDYIRETSKLYVSSLFKESFDFILNIAIAMRDIDSTNYPFSAFRFMENSKSVTLASSLNESKIIHYSDIPKSIIELEKQLQIERSFCQTQIQKHKLNKMGYDTAFVMKYEDKYFNYSMQYDTLIDYFEHNYPKYYKLKYQTYIATIPEIQKVLGDNTALLNYYVCDTNLFIIAVTDKLYKEYVVSINSSFQKSVTKYYQSIKKYDIYGFADNSHMLYEKLLKPVKQIIQNRERLIIIPDDYLYYVPFETLVDRPIHKDEEIDFTRLNYLVKEHSIIYHYSATLWLNTIYDEGYSDIVYGKSQMKRVKDENRNLPNFIGFAPVFDTKTGNGYILRSNLSVMDTTTDEYTMRSVSTDGKYLKPLPFTEEEVRSVIKLFEKINKEAKGYFYNEATEKNLAENSRDYKIVHIATHGFANDKMPYLSGLAFSQSKNEPGIETTNFDESTYKESGYEDGMLYMSEIYNLDLDADLVVLSACESGIGKMFRGEGLLSLTRGFLYSGTPNILFSLWKVNDEYTKDLMIEFYKGILKFKDYSVSLRDSKLGMIKNPYTAFPKFWSGFILIGK